ncbi:MAG: excinuclease ABC subunit C [Saprospiraceae bacterium]|nr:excinuclease ABC subunit C [Saprospiraceae bacterium]
MTTEQFKEILPSIPLNPGVYRFINAKEVILYVGKAKNLKNRLSSYFGEKAHITGKVKALTKSSSRIEYTIVETEQDALLLEATLIKANQPRYNVALKDGKTYSYICIRNEDFPRVFFTRKVIKDGSTYFGPYTSKFRVQTILDLIKGIFPLRTCTLNLSPHSLIKNKYKVCLEYHIKNCNGPCEKMETVQEYKEKLDQIKNILKGNFKPVKDYIHERMKQNSEQLQFEKAQDWKNKLLVFEDYQSKSTVVSTTIQDVDVFGITSDENYAYINYLKVIHGAIHHTCTIEAEKNLDEEEDVILSLAIEKLRTQYNSIAPELIVPTQNISVDKQLLITVPKIGDKKKLLELSEKNAFYFKMQKQKEAINKTKKITPAERILTTLKNDLQMNDIPLHIECFDNSNIQGTNPVAACVVFKNAKPSKKDYRHFNVKTVEGPNDFASMEEIVYRRYKRLLDESQPLPQLVIIDGGKGQLSSAMKPIEQLGLKDKLVVIGIAKKLEEIYYPEDSIPLHINKKSESLKLIQQLRNEAHRFGISFHRDKRSKTMIQSELDGILGIGEKTRTKLLTYFGSWSRIKEATEEEMIEAAGKAITNKIKNYLKSQVEQSVDRNIS